MEKQEYKTLGKCCPIFEQDRLHNKTHYWYNKSFVKESIPTFFHIPIPGKIGKKIEKMMTATEKAGMMIENKDETFILFHDPGAFKSNMYIPVKGEVSDLTNVKMSGTFKSKVYEAEYRDVPKVIKAMDSEMKEQGNKPGKFFLHYAYCPKCMKEAGTNYIVVFAELDEN